MADALNTRGVDRSGTITTGGTAQELAAENSIRTGLTVQNISDTDMWIDEVGGTAAAAGTGSFLLPANGGVYQVGTFNAISIFCATTGKAFTATEYR